jgi:hypothetical protein
VGSLLFGGIFEHITPDSVLNNDNLFLQIAFFIFYTSTIISLISFALLYYKKQETLKSIVLWTLLPIAISVILSPITTGLFYVIFCSVFSCLA